MIYLCKLLHNSLLNMTVQVNCILQTLVPRYYASEAIIVLGVGKLLVCFVRTCWLLSNNVEASKSRVFAFDWLLSGWGPECTLQAVVVMVVAWEYTYLEF